MEQTTVCNYVSMGNRLKLAEQKLTSMVALCIEVCNKSDKGFASVCLSSTSFFHSYLCFILSLSLPFSVFLGLFAPSLIIIPHLSILLPPGILHLSLPPSLLGFNKDRFGFCRRENLEFVLHDEDLQRPAVSMQRCVSVCECVLGRFSLGYPLFLPRSVFAWYLFPPFFLCLSFLPPFHSSSLFFHLLFSLCSSEFPSILFHSYIRL